MGSVSGPGIRSSRLKPPLLVLGALATFALPAGSIATPGCRKAPVRQESLHVAAAADLAFAFPDLGALYEKATGQKVVFSFGSTGVLERQVAEGAPFDAFASANAAFAEEAIASGACLAESKTLYATGRIALFAAKGTPITPRGMSDLFDPRIAKIAIANPAHAPYGRAAKEAMQRAGVWDSVAKEVVYGENVQQALEFAQTGNADVAIIALSLALVTPGKWTAIPEELHERIDQVMVACTHGRAGPHDGQRFIGFVNSEAGRAVLHRYGFLSPGELSTF
jgi:molybdate transport system substrate-binding protein